MSLKNNHKCNTVKGSIDVEVICDSIAYGTIIRLMNSETDLVLESINALYLVEYYNRKPFRKLFGNYKDALIKIPNFGDLNFKVRPKPSKYGWMDTKQLSKWLYNIYSDNADNDLVCAFCYMLAYIEFKRGNRILLLNPASVDCFKHYLQVGGDKLETYLFNHSILINYIVSYVRDSVNLPVSDVLTSLYCRAGTIHCDENRWIINNENSILQYSTGVRIRSSYNFGYRFDFMSSGWFELNASIVILLTYQTVQELYRVDNILYVALSRMYYVCEEAGSRIDVSDTAYYHYMDYCCCSKDGCKYIYITRNNKLSCYKLFQVDEQKYISKSYGAEEPEFLLYRANVYDFLHCHTCVDTESIFECISEIERIGAIESLSNSINKAISEG